MEQIERKRKAYRQLAARLIGTRETQQFKYGGQVRVASENSIAVGLPERYLQSIQILDTSSTNYGQFITMVDYDAVDGGSPVY